MKVFISWSGATSKAVAEALREWLPQVIQRVTPFVSSEDIRAGGRWQAEIADALQETSVGIICVTADNQNEPWLNFEAGALSKVVDQPSRVIPLAIGLAVSDVKQPLGQFQAQEATVDGIRKLVASINEASEEPLSEVSLERSFDQWWPALDEKLVVVGSSTDSSAAGPRTERELLEEILETVRGIARSGTSSGGSSTRLSILFNELTDLIPEVTSLSHTSGTNRIVVMTGRPVVGDEQTQARRLAGEHGYALDFLHSRPDSEP